MRLIEIAKEHGREYVTPEDVHDAINEGTPIDQVRLEVLKILGNIAGTYCEDGSLCAFIAFKGIERWN